MSPIVIELAGRTQPAGNGLFDRLLHPREEENFKKNHW